MTKKNQSKSNLYNFLIVKSQQLNQLYNSSLTDFSFTFNAGFNVLIFPDLSFYTSFIITIEDFKIIFPCVGMLPFTSLF